MHLNSELLFRKYVLPLLTDHARVLEIGPDDCPSTLQKASPYMRWHTADIAASQTGGGMAFTATTSVTYTMSDEAVLPVPSGAYDLVIAANVIEHVRTPFEWVREAARVVRKGGHVALICPISWPEHKAPVDCWRIYPDGMRALFDAASLETEIAAVERLEPLMSRRWYPGIPPTWGWDQLRRAPIQRAVTRRQRVQAMVGWPMPAALDCVGVARKC